MWTALRFCFCIDFSVLPTKNLVSICHSWFSVSIFPFPTVSSPLVTNTLFSMSIYVFIWCVAATAESLQSCPTLYDPIDGSPPGSPVPGIPQARTLEWVVICFSNACMHVKSLQSCPTLCDLWTPAYQALPSTGFSRQEHWSGLPFPSPFGVLGFVCVCVCVCVCVF